MPSINLKNEAHIAVSELSKIRRNFNSGKIDVENAKQSIGFFNATSRAISVALNAEKWEVTKKRKDQ